MGQLYWPIVRPPSYHPHSAVPPQPTASRSFRLLDSHITEPDRRTLGLKADRAFGGVGPGAFGDLDAVHGAGDRAVLADDLLLVPLADRLHGLLLGGLVGLASELRAVDREQVAGVG